MKPVVLVSKIGAVAYTNEYNKTRPAKLSSAGEQGTTEAVIAHLLKRNDIQIVYFGQWRGEVPHRMFYVQSDISGLTDLTTSKEQKERWVNDVSKIAPLKPRIHVTISGYAPTWCSVDNPHVSAVQACSIRYTAPVVNVIQKCKLPRIVIVNDIRNYPREGEMSHGWDWARPAALLSQRAKEWSRILMGVRWDVREVYSAAEHWREFVRLPRHDKIYPVTVVGHAHMLDGKKLKGYDDVWRTILSPRCDVEKLKSIGMRIYGKGWEHYSGFDSELMLGLLKPHEVMKILAESKTCPVTITGGELYTNKGRFCLAQRCLPLFYGRGGPYTYDPLGVQMPLNSDCRIEKPGDLLKLVRYFDQNDIMRSNLIDSLWAHTRPDYSLLDECINDLLAGHDTSGDAWWEKYGGYRRAGRK